MKSKCSSAWSSGMPQHETERHEFNIVTCNVQLGLARSLKSLPAEAVELAIHVPAVQPPGTTIESRVGNHTAARKHGYETASVAWRIGAWLL